MKKNLSFVIPSFNQGRFIRATLDSIADQGLDPSDFEVLVFDGGSSDETLDILKSHPLSPRWVSRKDNGQTDAINRGLLAAQGEIIAWINSDDIYVSGTIRRVVEAFKTNPTIYVIYGRAELIDATGEKIGEYPVESWNYARLSNTCFLCQPAVFFRRSLVEKYGLLDESLHYAMDYEYWLRVGKHVEFFFIDAVFAASRVYAETKTLRDKPGVFREGLEVVRRHTGEWSRDWLRGYGYWLVQGWCERFGVRSALMLAGLVALVRGFLRVRCFLRGFKRS